MMRNATLIAPRTTRLEMRDPPVPGAGEVRVRVRACGVCASELHAWEGDDRTYPRILGHEVAGEVIAVGADVRGFAPGQRVTGLFGNGFAEEAVTLAERVVPLPDALSWEAGSAGEPLACVVSAARRTRVEVGDTVALVGLGFMGLLMLQLLRLTGAARIVGIDPRPEARDAARRFGADAVAHPDEAEAWRARRDDPESGLPLAVETTGVQAGLTLAGTLVRQHGMLSILGYHQGEPRSVDMEDWNFKAIDVLNAHERRHAHKVDCLRRGIALVAAGRVAVEPLFTHRTGLDGVDDAFRALRGKPTGYIKAVVLPMG